MSFRLDMSFCMFISVLCVMCKCERFMYDFVCSLTEGTSKGSHFAIKEGNTQKHTQSVKQNYRQPAADRKGPLKKSVLAAGF